MSRLSRILDKIIDNQTIQTKTVSGTTNAQGALRVSALAKEDTILDAGCTNNPNAKVTAWRYNDNDWYVQAVRWDTGAQIGNTSLTFTIRYLGGYCIAVFSRLSAISSLVRRWRHEQVVQRSGCYRIQINDYSIILNVLRTVQVWGSSYRTVLEESSDKIGWGFIRHDSRSVSSKRRSGLHCVQYIGDVFRNNSVQGKWGDCSNIREPNRWDNKIHCDVHKVALSERGCVA